MIRPLVAGNHPGEFWRFTPAVPLAAWDEALHAIATEFPDWSAIVRTGGWDALLAWILAEEQFGADRYRMGMAKRAYYTLKPVLPRVLTRAARKAYRGSQEKAFPLGWPAEERYARFLHALGDHVQAAHPGSRPAPFWPDGKRWSVVLTHDVETRQGQDFIRDVAALEERHGFRSSFNFIPERYRPDRALMGELRERGFEVGVHGLKHDGKLFFSRRVFDRRAPRINQYVREWGATGFRAPLTHRNPDWLQALDVEYDLSFFDTDPYEPMPGGVMTIWPYRLGRFIELPYTLVQDYTLLSVMGETTPAVWLEKAALLRRHQGMALLNTHPDYLRVGAGMEVYAAFLEAAGAWSDAWRALPVDAARWWRSRAEG